MLEATSTAHGQYLHRPTARMLAAFRDLFRLVPRDGNPAPIPPARELSDQQIRDLIAREGHGNSHDAIRVIARDRAKASKRARDAEDKLADLEKKGRIAPDGAVIVAGDEAKAWPAVVKFLGENKLTLEKLIEQAGKVPELSAKVAETERRTQRASAAKDVGYNAAALDEVLSAKGLDLEERDTRVQRDGKFVTEKVWSVRKAGDSKAEWAPLIDYAEEHLGVFMASLTADDDDDGTENASTAQGSVREERTAVPPKRGQGTVWPEQSRSRPAPQGGAKSEADLRKEAIAADTYAPL